MYIYLNLGNRDFLSKNSLISSIFIMSVSFWSISSGAMLLAYMSISSLILFISSIFIEVSVELRGRDD